ncbi:MAG: hypothetical protein IJY74_03110, partial [Oscillospiraceae bacterium]|nr:hypothetical protein [Oscillospiraceae bacterium]
LDVEYTYTDGTVETLDIGSVDVAAGGDYLSPIQIDFPCFDLPNATTSAKIIVSSGGVSFSYTNFRLVQDFYNVNGSFSQGTGSISYAYQGMLWNQAISGYYSDATALNLDGDTGNDIVPLYFGSNSWMSGNGRYDKIDSDEPFASLFTDAQVSEAMNYPYPTFWNGDTNILNTLQSLFVMADTGKDGGAYLIPFQRHYWKKLSGFDNELSDGYTWIESINEAMGQSNSRGVPGLVKLQYDGNNSKNSILSLTNTDNSRETPYFNDAFIEGENSLNAKLGEYYDDVNFDFVMNTDENSPNNGYYEYDSTRSKYATRLSWNQDIGYYIDYYNYAAVAAGNEDVWGVKKADNDPDGDVNGSSQTINQFYPFNSPDSSNNFATENLMFGMHLDIPFNMYKDKAKREKSVFKFSGDDDVWVYVDGQEVLDIGGTHTAVGGFIDLKNGYSIQGSTFSDYTGLTTDAAGANEAFAAISSSDDGIYNSGTDTGITIAEKAAFAVLASQEEINFLTTAGTIATVDDINNLAVGGATEWTDGIVINGDDGNLSNDSMDEDSTNTTLTKAAFFDDTFIPADGASNISFQYRARRASTDEWVIDIRVRDIRISDTTQKRVDKNISDVEGKEIVTYVNASFSLSTFKLDMNDGISTAAEIDNNADLVDHMLTIYYMERGLNSSNFKLAFNMVLNTEREVQKEWADDKNSEAHNDVTVELYRTEPDLGKKEVITGTEKVTEQTPYNVPNFTYIKVEGAKTDGTYQANQGFYEQDATIQTYYQAYAFDTNVYLTMNGQFIGDFNKGITDAAETFTDANGNGVYDKAEEYSDANSNGSYDAGETYVDADGDGQYDAAETFTDANNDGEYNSGDVIQYAYHYLSQSNLGLKIYFVPTSDAGTTENITLNEDNYSEYIGMDAKGYYFKVPANYQLWIDFNAVDSVRIKNNNESTTVNPYNIYNFTAAQGWLIKSHAYTRNDDGSSNDQVNMEAKLRNKGANTYYDAGTGRTYGKDNIDLKFVITKNTRGYNNGTGQYPFYEYNYNAMIVPVGDSITLTSDVKNFDSSKNATYNEN